MLVAKWVEAYRILGKWMNIPIITIAGTTSVTGSQIPAASRIAWSMTAKVV